MGSSPGVHERSQSADSAQDPPRPSEPTSPARGHAPSGHAPPGHATSGHAPSGHAPSDHATSDHATSDHATPDARRHRLNHFRRANATMAFWSSGAVSLANVLYLATTPQGPNRTFIWIVALVAITNGIATMVIARRWRLTRQLIHSWTGTQLVLISVAAAADGGLSSPFMVILALPISMSAMVMSPRAMRGYTALAVVAIVLVGYSSGSLALGPVAIWSTTIVGLSLVGLGFANNTRRLTRKLNQANKELLELSRKDPLTGVLNHRCFYEEVDLALARAHRSEAPVSVLVLDIDHFKDVNDHHGHPVGDEVLRAVAGSLRASTRTGDVVARTGGEEFAVLMPDTSLADAASVAERVRATIADAGGPVPVTASAGLSAFPEHGTTSSRLVRIADDALYAAKHAGRDRLSSAPC